MTARQVLGLLATGLLLAGTATATSIVPPENLGQLASQSRVVVLGEALRSRVVQRGPLLFTETTFVVEQYLKGELPRPGAKQEPLPLDVFKVLAPGGELENSGWLVSGRPRFQTGEYYLLMLDGALADRMQLRLASWGVLHRVAGRDGSTLLAPLPEAEELQVMPRADGAPVEPVGTYREEPLLDLLAGVSAGQEAWNAAAALADPAQVPIKVSAATPPSSCKYMTSSAPYTRWHKFDPGQTGQVTINADSDTDPTISGGGLIEVQGALSAWNGTTSSLQLNYGGTVSFSLACDSNYNEVPSGSPEVPPAGTNIVVFADPCNDIPDLSHCAGYLGYGGPYWSGTHTFDGATWNTITSWFVVLNNGLGCMGSTNYRLVVEHELGHGLGFGHSSDSSALMYAYCCHEINATDETCAEYTYPLAGAQPPSAPTGVTATDGTYADHVRVSWSASSGADSYKVYRYTSNNSGSASQIGTPTASPYDDYSATPGTTYYYWVKATNANGDSGFSAPDTGFAATAPAAPSSVSATDGTYADRVRVSWGAVSGATSYKVFRNTANSSGTATQLGSPTGSPYDDLAATPGTTYYYWVKAANVAGDSDFGGPDTGYARVCTAPAAPVASAPAVAGSAQNYTVTWSGTSPANTYEIQEATNGAFSGATTYSVSATQRTLSHIVVTSTTYYYRVRAADCSGPLWSGYSATVTTDVIPCDAPAAPALSAPAGAESGGVYTVSWTATSPDGSYELDEANNASFTGASTFSVSATSRDFTHTAATPTTYYYRVRALDTCGTTTYASANSGTGATVVTPCSAPAAPAPSAPASVPAGQSFTVSWTATSPDNAYQLDEATDPAFASAATTAVTGTSVQLTRSPAGDTTYSFRVRAVDTCGGTPYVSTNSAAVSTLVTVCSPPAAPALAAPGAGATVAGPSVALSWGAVAGATSYDVYFASGAVPALVANVATTSYGVAVADGTSYSWKVVARNACGQAESEVRGFVACSAPAAPVASFTWSPQGAAPGFPAQQQPYAGQAVQLTDTSTNSPTAWNWYDFQGAGITYSVQNPVHTWASSGAKNVRLVAANCAGSSGEKLIAVTVYADTRTVTADFTWSAATREVPVTFTAAQGYAYGDPTDFTWTFKDNGATASGATATHTFGCGGAFDVVLTAKRGGYQGTATKSVTVAGQACCDAPGIPVAGFTVAPLGPAPDYPQQLQPYVGQSVTLGDTSTNSPTTWTWTGLPAGSATTQQSPTVTWLAPDTYAVGLVAANCAGPSPAATRQVTVYPDIRPVAKGFDFGTPTSPVGAGYQQVTAHTTYSAATGFGWLAGVVDDRDRGVGSALTRDLNFTADGTFAVDVPAGIYDVTATMGDATSGHDEFGVFIEGRQFDTITTAAGEWVARTYQVALADRQLALQLRDLGGVDSFAVINSLTVVTATTRRFDFGTATSPVEPGYVPVSDALRYTPARGYGWLSGTVASRDRGVGTALTRDLDFTPDGTFAADVPDGDYDVTVYLGDTASGHDDCAVWVEGTNRELVTTAAGTIATRTYRTTVADGQLTLRLQDAGGADAVVAIVGLEIARVRPPSLRITLPGHVVLEFDRVPGGSAAAALAAGAPVAAGQRLISRGPITVAQWRAVMGAAPATAGAGAGDPPVAPVAGAHLSGTGGFVEKLNAWLAATGQGEIGPVRLAAEPEGCCGAGGFWIAAGK